MAINELELQPEQEQKTGNSFLDDLLSFVEEAEVEELDLTTVDEGFSIQNMDQANFIAKKVKEVRAEMEEAAETAQAYLESYQEKISNWLEKTQNPLRNQEAYLLRLLENFARTKLEGSNKKSLKLIEGTLQFRKQQDKYEYEDNVLLTYAENNLPQFIKTKLSVDKTELKKKATVKNGELYIDGVLVPGVTVTAQDEKFDVK
ncbi:host-nuclease inhibitor Gam family protein [Heyndrickxia sporothermodurans]|uniref:host-nuclease inhibitor Gam family protein n=1 Tax=Heyndrickxia sporothermodurans TaxID=46224 RepID=UPI000D3BE485|nr:host-nuclease inhibitor Gam family protein [Heyndrickxia sporothermodurans]PTY93009.1 hypothetical protein B5V90_02700 [Heyndrickxia sporothermodurans]